ncbi:MAG: transcription termination/antitermination factor NusG [Spirochaetes bacterium]|nr:transcription termination/antitermination factor NusG [Spirochaetota bacterium]
MSEETAHDTIPAPTDSAGEKKWFIVHTQSGYEKKVKERILKRAGEAGMQDLISNVFIPSETVTELRNGKKVSREERFYPGYVLVEMVMNDVTWTLVRRTPGVAGFIGSHATTKEEGRIIPEPLKDEDLKRLFDDKQAAKKKGEMPDTIKIEYEVGEKVRVIDGPFNGLNGVIEHINPDKGKITVRIEIFGRATPTEIDFMKVKKL